MSTTDLEQALKTEVHESFDDLLELFRISEQNPTNPRLREDGRMAQRFLAGGRRRGQLTPEQTAVLDAIELARSAQLADSSFPSTIRPRFIANNTTPELDDGQIFHRG